MKRFVLLLAAVVILGIVLMFLPVKTWFLASRHWVEALGFWGPAAMALIYATLTIAMIPGSALTLGLGLLFGLWVGVATAVVGANLGALGAFLLARTLLRSKAEALAHASPKFNAIDSAIARQGFKIVLLLRLSPVFPFTILNVLLGVSKVTTGAYVLANLLGMLPGTFLYVYLGSLGEAATGGNSLGQIALKVGGLAATVAVTVFVTRIAKKALVDIQPQASPA